MQKILAITATTLALLGSGAPALAQNPAPQAPAAPATTAAAPAASGLPWVAAEVRRVDARAGKITLKHGEIPNLEMPPMTMVFGVRDPALLVPLKPGDRVRVTIDKQSGSYQVMELQRSE